MCTSALHVGNVMAGVLERPVGASAFAGWQAAVLPWKPPRIALGLSAAALAMHLALWGTTAPFGRAAWVGGALMLIGMAWAAWARAMFHRAGTEIRPTRAPGVLVDDGPFRHSRNPMYLGLAATIFGAATAMGSPFLLIAAAAFIAIVSAVHIPFEEAQALKRFGGWYRDYAASVRRWL